MANASQETGLPKHLPVEAIDCEAMQNMLDYQASCLIKMHNALMFGKFAVDPAWIHIPRRLKVVELASHTRLYAYRFDQVPHHWRQIYADAQILTTFYTILESVGESRPSDPRQAFLKILDEVIVRLDRSLITAGGGDRKTWIEQVINMFHQAWEPIEELGCEEEFSKEEPFGRPTLTRPCARHQDWSFIRFAQYMKRGQPDDPDSGETGPEPIVFTDLTKDVWPAIHERRWFRPNYLFNKTTGGRRLVPIEIGRSYVDAEWGQELLPFREFVIRYIDGTVNVGDAANATANPTASASASVAQPGYLAQHNLFEQIHTLRNDIQPPDFCWADVPRRDPLRFCTPRPELVSPEVNAWFGPAGTITPLHTDSYTNLLCQVVGVKYVRLYPPGAREHMRPMSDDVNGVDMSNTSAIDLGAIEGWDQQSLQDTMGEEDDEALQRIQEARDSLRGVEYFECILEPGDTLLIPMGWWHCVRSLSVSFSVSFWWN